MLNASAWFLLSLGAAPNFYDQLEATGKLEMAIQTPPSEKVLDIVYSPDGRLFATFDSQLVKIWTDDGRMLRSFVGARPLAFSADGKSLWEGIGRGASRLDLYGKVLERVSGTRENVLAFPDGEHFLLAFGGAQYNELHIFDKKGAQTETVRTPFGGAIYTAAIRSDGQRFACAGGEAFMLLSRDGTLLSRLGTGGGQGIAFSRDGKRIATGNEKTVTVWSVEDERTPKQVASIPAPSGWNTGAVAFTPDGRGLMVGFGSSAFVGTGAMLRRYAMDGTVLWESAADGAYQLTGVAASRDGKLLATAGGDTVRLWSTDGRLRRVLVQPKDERGWINIPWLDFSPDASKLLVVTSNRAALYATATGDLLLEKPTDGDVAGGAFSPDGRHFGFAGSKRAFVFDSSTGREVRQFQEPVESFTGFAFLSDGRVVRSAGRKLIIADLSTGAEEVGTTEDGYLQAGISASGSLIAVGHRKKVTIVDAHAKPTSQAITVDQDPNAVFPPVRALALSPDAKTLAVSWGMEGALGLFSLEGKLLQGLEGHGMTVSRLAFSGDGKLLFSASWDTSVRIWNLKTGATVALVARGEDWTAFTPDGYFDAGRNGGRLVSMTKGVTGWGVDQFAIRNNRPDLILERLGNASPGVIAHYRSQYLRRLRRAGLTEAQVGTDLAAPRAIIVSAEVVDGRASLKASCDGRGRALARYSVFVNDVPVFGALGKASSGSTAAIAEQVALAPGRNKLEVSCVDGAGAESPRALAYLNAPAASGPGDLWFLGFGVSKYADPALALKYAHKDAQDLAKALNRLKGSRFAAVHVNTFVDSEVTPQAIKNARALVAGAKANDTLVLFIAGHGVHDTDKEATYYYLTHGADLKHLATTAANFDDVESILQGVAPLQKLFLMDTCESGEADERVESAQAALAGARGILARGLVRKQGGKASGEALRREWLVDRSRYIYNDLQRRSGAIVFSSSRGGELSYERDDLENGVFTSAIIKTLAGNRPVPVLELREKVTQAVSVATGGLQNPTVDRDNLAAQFGL